MGSQVNWLDRKLDKLLGIAALVVIVALFVIGCSLFHALVELLS